MSIEQLDDEARAVLRPISTSGKFDVPTTRAAAVRAFFGHPTPVFIVLAVMCACAARLRVAEPLSAAESSVLVATPVLWWVQEWLLHRALHVTNLSVHTDHHLMPFHHVSIDSLPLAVVWFAVVGAIAIRSLPRALALSSVAAYTACGGIYSWVHFAVHTRIPLSGHWARVRARHLLHHVHSHEHWLSFTMPVIDDLFGTAPRARDVPRAFCWLAVRVNSDAP